MAGYDEMYGILFNAITDVIETLQKAQQACEALYMEKEEAQLVAFSSKAKKESTHPK